MIPALPPDASSEGHRIDDLLHRTAGLAAIVAILALAYLAVVLVRYRRGHVAQHGAGRLARGGLVAIALTTVIFGVIDGSLFATSSRDLDAMLAVDQAEAEPGAVRVELNAHQWSWDVRYPGPDGRFGTADDATSLDELVVPLGHAVVIELAAVDVVHSLAIPAMRVKLDAVPGHITRTWFRPRALGRYEIACAQFCGVGHYRMRGLVTVVPEAEFTTWLADQVADAERLAAEDARAVAEEPDRLPEGYWPSFETADPTAARAWAWPWRGEAAR